MGEGLPFDRLDQKVAICFCGSCQLDQTCRHPLVMDSQRAYSTENTG